MRRICGIFSRWRLTHEGRPHKHSDRQRSRKILLFLKKKKQKDFCQFGAGRWRSRAPKPNEQKFFASFFQKRRFFPGPF
jgi:hypothetical protein